MLLRHKSPQSPGDRSLMPTREAWRWYVYACLGCRNTLTALDRLLDVCIVNRALIEKLRKMAALPQYRSRDGGPSDTEDGQT